MLPVFTTDQVKDGVDTGDLLIDLSEYMKKKDGATKTELDSLTAVVANKLDVEPQHKHHIDDVKQLQSALDGKFDKTELYAYNTILSDVDKIAYIEAPKVQHLEVAMNSTVEGYNFYVDDANGDLMILSPSSALIASYSMASNSWSFGGVSLNDIANNETITEHDQLIKANSVDIATNSAKITAVQDALNTHTHDEYATVVETADLKTKITEMEAVLQNHYDALMLLLDKHDMVDSNPGDGSSVTPQ